MHPDDDRLRIAPQLAKEWGRDIPGIEFSDEEMKHPNTAGIVFEN